MTAQDIIQAFVSKSVAVKLEDFEARLKTLTQAEFSPGELHELLNFASEQAGWWTADWLFSEQADPDLGARHQSEAWEKLWAGWHGVLAQTVPEATGELKREHDLIVLGHTLRRRVEFNRTRPVERLVTQFLSSISLLLNKVGLVGIAGKLYERSLYPQGTVGRTA